MMCAGVVPQHPPMILAPARNHSPSFIRLRVCRLNDENVVKPPQKPAMTNCRATEPTM